MFKEATMIRSLYTVPAMLCLAAAVVTAQAPAAPAADRPAPAAQQPAAQPPARPAEASTPAANKVTYVGCVKPGAGSETWILESAELAPKPGAEPSTVGTSGASKLTLNLNPAATVNLKPHANHKVEVVGTLSPARAGADAAASTPGTPSRQQFSVESFKMVAATCP
jgi:hypothetical protein